MRREAAGVTLVELLVGLALLGLALMGLFAAYASSVKAAQQTARLMSLSIGKANLEQVLRPAIQGATCILTPANKGEGDVLILRSFPDCVGGPRPTPQFQAFCRVSGALLYAKGSGTPSSGYNCSGWPTQEVFALTPIGVELAPLVPPSQGIFLRDPANVIEVDLVLKTRDFTPTRPGPTHHWEARILTQMPLAALPPTVAPP